MLIRDFWVEECSCLPSLVDADGAGGEVPGVGGAGEEAGGGAGDGDRGGEVAGEEAFVAGGDAVAHGGEGGDGRLGEAGGEDEVGGGGVDAWSFEGFLNAHAGVDDVLHELGVAVHDLAAAGGAEGDGDGAVLAGEEGGGHVGERALAASDGVGAAGFGVEPHHAVVEQDAGAGDGDAAAPDAEQGLGEGDGETVPVDGAEVGGAAVSHLVGGGWAVVRDGDAKAVGNAHAAGVAGADGAEAVGGEGGGALGGVGAVGEDGEGGVDVLGVGEPGEAVGEGLAEGLGGAVDGFGGGGVEGADVEFVEEEEGFDEGGAAGRAADGVKPLAVVFDGEGVGDGGLVVGEVLVLLLK